MHRKLAAGNWKMNGTATDLAELETLARAHPAPRCDILICPPATLIERASARTGDAIAIGGQDCHAATGGAHTGDISGAMLADAGASHVILGHSERRADHNESNADIHARMRAAWATPLTAILCIGETEAQYKSGDTLSVLQSQLSGSLPDEATAENTVIAYEPVWAIGTGLVPTLDEIGAVHRFIRARLAGRFEDARDFRILYGGSVKPSNAAGIFAVPDVDGALVGGASLKATDFSPIISALEAS